MVYKWIGEMCMDDEAFDECNQLLNIFWLLAKRLLERGEGKKFDYRDTTREMPKEEEEWKEIQMENNRLFSTVIEESRFRSVLNTQHGKIKNMLDARLYIIKQNVEEIETEWIPAIRNLAEDNSVSLINKSTTWHAIEKLTAIAERLAGQHS